METITKTNHTFLFIHPCDDPLNILDNIPIKKECAKPINKEVYLPINCFKSIMAYLPKPVIKPEKYSIMTNALDNGYFCIIKRLTPKCVVYDKFKYTDRDTYGYFTISTNNRSKLRKNKDGRYNYIISNGDEYIISNKLPTRVRVIGGINTKLFMNTEEYKRLLKNEYYYSENWLNEELPIKIEENI